MVYNPLKLYVGTAKNAIGGPVALGVDIVGDMYNTSHSHHSLSVYKS